MRYFRLKTQMEMGIPIARSRNAAANTQNVDREAVDTPRQQSMNEAERAGTAEVEQILQLDAEVGREVTTNSEAYQIHTPPTNGVPTNQHPSTVTNLYDPHGLGRFQNFDSPEFSFSHDSFERFPPMFIDPRLRSYNSTPTSDATSEPLSYPNTSNSLPRLLQGSPPISIPPPWLSAPFQTYSSSDASYE